MSVDVVEPFFDSVVEPSYSLRSTMQRSKGRHIVAPPTIMWLICQRRRLPKVAPSQCSIALNAYQNVSKLDQAYIRWTLFSKNPGPLYCHCLGEESLKTHIARTILSAYLTNDELRPIQLNVVKRIKLFLTTCIYSSLPRLCHTCQSHCICWRCWYPPWPSSHLRR